ncbi:PepSY-associated TM helix domain-containing protein [Caballeronia sp. dw_19]|uniref:PepSY-associated TM helix domain-containing protein n=1 Tax=Caballeronia sp. dw_19 TaxID=2719791 RepID=UPI0032119D22
MLDVLPGRMPPLRRLWLTAHRWFALSLGWVLAIMGITGALLMIGAPVDERLHADLFKVGAHEHASAVPLEQVRQRFATRFGDGATFSFRPPRTTDESLRVMVKGKWSGTVYIDPFTGDELGRRAQTQGFFNVLFKLHSSLWLGDIGKALLAFVALCYLLLLVSGLVLWWPRSGRPNLRVELRKGTSRALYDLHRVGGATIGLVIALSVATGAYMAWRPLGGFVSTLSGVRPMHAPVLPLASRSPRPMLPLDTLVAQAQAQFPDAMIGLVQLPAKPGVPLRVRLKLPDDPHPNGLSSVWLDPFTGKVLEVRRWNALDPGARAVAVIYPLHTGELGGPLLEGVLAIGGMSLGVIAVTGIWQWWRRRKIRVARTR